MAEISKQALKVDNNQSFPNNNNGAITPSILRAFNVNMIDSMVDEIPFGAYTQSVNTSLNALNQFTASVSGLNTGSLLVTASAAGNVITFTKGNNTTFNVTVATGSIPDISNLNQATASLQAFTQSAQISINNLNTTTQSLNTSVSNINTFTASAAVSITNLNASSASQQVSIDNLNSKTGSYATTGSNTFVGANTFTSISASSFISASQFIGDGTKITGITASISLPILDEGIPQGNAFSMNFTGSAISAIVVGGTAVVSVNVPDTGSFNALTASFNQYTASTNSSITQLNANTASQQVSINSLNAATGSYVTETESGSFLLTASFDNGTRNLTFTKGNNTTFAVNIPDVSGSAGNFVTTSSFNSYTSSNDQRVNSLEVTSASLLVETQNLELFSASALVSISNLNASSASQQTSINALNVFTASQSTASIVTSITNLNQFTQSAGVSINSLNAATSSYVTSAITASSLVTASFNNGTRNLTFTKGDTTTFSVNIPDVSGSTGNFVTTSSFNAYTSSNDQKVNSLIAATGSYATTGSNTFNGVQTIRATGGTPLIVDHSDASPTQNTLIGIFKSGSAEWSFGNLGTDDSFIFYNPNTFQTPLAIRQDNSVNILGSLTASLQQGYAWVGNGSNVSSLVATSSFGSTINTGSFATTGSNTFTGDQTFIDNANNFFTISDTSGSMMLVGKAMTSSSLHISASAAAVANGAVNLIFKTNNLTADLILSGSNNIFQNPVAAAAGFKRYLSSNNIALGAGFPSISSSMQFSPSVTNNYFGAQALTMRGPVSASAWTISNNNLLGAVSIGSGAGVNSAEKLTSTLTMTGNAIAGNFNVVVGVTALTGSTVTITNNNINGGGSLTLNQSSVTFSNNNINDNSFGITNNYFSQSAGLGTTSVSRNNIAGFGNLISVTGSQPAGTNNQLSIMDNFIGGGENSIFADATTARVVGVNAYHSATRNIIFGNSLIVSASSLVTDTTGLGSAFFGRFNDVNGNKDLTAETIFAIGTGTSTSNRKTGFLIDSGSNTFIEGTLNVSGSTTMTGSLILSSSNAVELFVIGAAVFTGSVAGNVLSASITSNTASIDFNLANYFEVTSSVTPLHLNVTNISSGRTVTLIVSASASSSITFSPNVAQPSGSAYSGSLGSIDILSLVAFNTSKVNLVSTKALV
jgi:hypothetical protein